MHEHVSQKRSSRKVLVFFGAFLLLSGTIVLSQSVEEVHVQPRNHPENAASIREPASALDVPGKAFQAAVDVVLVPVVVTDTLNRPVTNLTKQDFALFEDGRSQPIQYFSREQAPISIALLLDVSKSMSNKVEAERAAVAEFVKNANPDDEYFAIAFADRPRLLAEATQSVDEVERRLVSAERGGATAMLDAIYLAESKLRSARYKRRAIVVISDGGDNSSRYTLREVKKLVRESDVQIYAIGLFDSFFRTVEEKLGKEWLSEITDATGGRTVTVSNQSKLPEAAAAISWEMRNEYVLGYRAANTGTGGWRTIRVRLTSPAGGQQLTIHFRRGYFAQAKTPASR